MVGAVVDLYSGTVTCSRDNNTRHQYNPEKLYFYYQNAFGGRAPPGPARGVYSTAQPPAVLKGRANEGGWEEGERKGERRPHCWKCVEASVGMQDMFRRPSE